MRVGLKKKGKKEIEKVSYAKLDLRWALGGLGQVNRKEKKKKTTKKETAREINGLDFSCGCNMYRLGLVIR